MGTALLGVVALKPPSEAPRSVVVDTLILVLLAAPWAFAALLLAKQLLLAQRTHWFAFGLGAAMLWVLLIGYFLFAQPIAEYFKHRDFDAAAWRAAPPDFSTRRSEAARLWMVDDLVSSGVLDGNSRAEVLALLGPDDGPHGTGWLRSTWPGWDALYWLGPTFVPVDSEWLAIRYGADERVLEYKIVVD